MRSLARTAVVMSVCLFFFSSVAATAIDGFAPPHGKKKKPMRQRFMATGTIEALLPNSVIKFTHGTNETCLVKIEAPKRQRDKKTRRYVLKGGTEVEVTGTAKPDFLRAGMYVRFSAGFNAKGKTSDEIDLIRRWIADGAER